MAFAPLSDEEVARHILSIFGRHSIPAMGLLRRNNFMEIRDGDFQRGMDRAVHNKWIQPHSRDRYRYILTNDGSAASRRMHSVSMLVGDAR